MLPECIEMTHVQYGIVVSIYTVGGLLGSLIGGRLADNFGRRTVSMYNTAGFVLGPAIAFFSVSIPTLSVARFVSGVSSGIVMVVVPVYLSELAPESIKGPVGVMNQLTVCIGILTAQLMGLFLSKVPQWRIIVGLGAAVALLQLIMLQFCCESPVWLAMHEKRHQAEKDLKRLRGRDDVEEELNSMHASPNAEEEEALLRPGSGSKEYDVGYWEFLTTKEHRHGCRAVIGTMLAQQFTGINSIVFYGVYVLTPISSNSALLNVFISTINIFVTLMAVPLINRLGRKVLLLISTAGMGICSCLLAVGISQKISLLSAIAAVVFVSSFAIGLGPVPFVLIGEVNKRRAVGVAGSVALTTNWIATFLVAYLFPILTQAIGGMAFFVFTGFAALVSIQRSLLT